MGDFYIYTGNIDPNSDDATFVANTNGTLSLIKKPSSLNSNLQWSIQNVTAGSKFSSSIKSVAKSKYYIGICYDKTTESLCISDTSIKFVFSNITQTNAGGVYTVGGISNGPFYWSTTTTDTSLNYYENTTEQTFYLINCTSSSNTTYSSFPDSSPDSSFFLLFILC